MTFLEELKFRNEALFYFGFICLVLAIIFLILTRFTTTQVYNVNAWYKPFKFAASTTLYAWAIVWFIGYLPNFDARIFNWVIIITLGFEIIYIAWQASRGMLSHFNVSTSFYSFMYSMMALAATIATLATAYIGILFFKNDFPDLPLHYVWSIRLGIFLFVVFAFEGFVMGSRMTHTIGGQDGGESIPILNWSTQYGDPRIAHFIGMHALQVLPILSYYVFRNITFTVIIAILYGLVAVFSLVKALQGKLIIG